MPSSKVLGKGFDSLLPIDFDPGILSEEQERIQKVDVKSIQPNPDQPRRTFDESALEELAASIKEHGIVQPLVVTPSGNEYIIVAGERRWRAAQIAGLTYVPVIARTLPELEQLEIALIENVQRVDLSPLEQAVSILRLHEQFGSSWESIAKRLGKAVPTVNNIVRLLQLPAEAKQALLERKISEGHARSILALKHSPELQLELLQLIITEKWSVRQAEQFVISHRQDAKDKARERASEQPKETVALAKKLGTSVTVKRTAKGGRLELHFKNDAEYEALCARLLK